MATHCSILAWEIHGQRSLVGYSLWGLKESGTTERLSLFTALTPLVPISSHCLNTIYRLTGDLHTFHLEFRLSLQTLNMHVQLFTFNLSLEV